MCDCLLAESISWLVIIWCISYYLFRMVTCIYLLFKRCQSLVDLIITAGREHCSYVCKFFRQCANCRSTTWKECWNWPTQKGKKEMCTLCDFWSSWTHLLNYLLCGWYIVCYPFSVQNGNTALMEASESGHNAVVKVLVANGADIKEKNKVGFLSQSTSQFIARSIGAGMATPALTVVHFAPLTWLVSLSLLILARSIFVISLLTRS